MKLRSVELEVPRVAVAQPFLTEVWGLRPVENAAGTRGSTAYFRGTADQPYVIALTESANRSIRSVTFSGSAEEVRAVRGRAQAAGHPVGPMTDFDEPGRGHGFLMEGPETQVYRFVAEKDPTAALPVETDRPLQLTHCVLNTKDRPGAVRFAQEVLGFKLSDRTRGMSFMRCESTHHSLAYVDAHLSSLNHLAFEMPTLDSVMRGIGRMLDHGHKSVWGPGRHGPGNNVFAYFVAPFGGIIEYTSEIQRVDDSYKTGAPEDWTWPPARGDQWGIGGRDAERMGLAEQTFKFKAFAGATALA